MSPMAFPEIPRTVMAHLLDLCGSPGVMSPRHLMGTAASLTPLQIAELYAAEYLTRPEDRPEALSPTFVEAARVLLDPVTNLTFRMWGAENLCAETNILFPGDVVAGSGVVLQPIEQYYRFAAFVEPDDIVEDLRPVLPPSGDGNGRPFDLEAHLDAAVAAVLFAVADLERGRGLDVGESGYSEVDISAYLCGRWGFTDFGQLLSYVTTAGMQSLPPSSMEVEIALGILVQGGAVRVAKTTPDRYVLSPAMRPLVDLTKDLSSGLQWQRVTLLESGDTLIVNRIYVYGDEGLTLCLSPTVRNRLLVSSVSREDVVRFVVDELSGVAGASSQVSDRPAIPMERDAVAAASNICPSCGVALEEGQSFCTQCGARVEAEVPEVSEPKARFCTQCGAALEAGSRFCTQCGANAEV